MHTPSTQELVKLKIIAFLFNTRADALRGEIYQALCLHVLHEAGDPCTCEEIAALVAYALGKDVRVTASLRTIILDELRRLTEDGVILHDNGDYYLRPNTDQQLPDEAGQEQLYSAILQELRKLALELNSSVSRTQVNMLFDFYMEASSLIAAYQASFVSRGLKPDEVELDPNHVTDAVAECQKRHGIGSFIDVDQFILRSLLRPAKVLADYLYRLIQVNVITQLLTWDPSLEHLQDQILSGKTLYLDSSILFALMLFTHPLHAFLTSLLKASRVDLGVRIKCSERTINEYQNVLTWADASFSKYSRTLRDVAKSCKKYDDDPAEFVESSVYADYVSHNLDRVDPGSWQAFINTISQKALRSLLKEFSIEIDMQDTYVPRDEFFAIKTAMLRASRVQVDRGARTYVKTDTEHDAKLYYLVDSVRKKRSFEGASFSYDTYLLTLDGSLVHFRKIYNIPFLETYFIYPNQWYQLAFPFLRIRSSEHPGFAAGLASLIFSGAFPDVLSLIPLELCAYIFERGGTNLSMGSVRSLVEGLLEERTISAIDPANEDRRGREEADLRVQRMIAEEELKLSRHVQEIERRTASLKEKTESLRGEFGELTSGVEELQAVHEDLSLKVSDRAADLAKYGEMDAKIRSVKSEYEEQIASIEAQRIVEQQTMQQSFQQEIEKERAQQQEMVAELRDEIRSIRRMNEDVQADRRRVEEENARRLLAVKKLFVIGSMAVGLLSSLLLAIEFSVGTWATVFSIAFMLLGLILYYTLPSKLWAFVAFSIGVVVVTGAILIEEQLNTLLWIIPMGWEMLVLGLQKVLK